MTVVEIIVSIFLLIGTGVMLLSTAGVIRFGDVFLRMHAATKSGTLGIGFIIIGVALYFGESLITVKLLSLSVIYFFTSPIGSQVLAYAAHVARIPLVKETWIDDLKASQTAESDSDS